MYDAVLVCCGICTTSMVQATKHDPDIAGLNFSVSDVVVEPRNYIRAPEMTAWNRHCRAVGTRGLHAREHECQPGIRPSLISGFGLINMCRVIVLVITMQPLGLCARADAETHSDRENRLTRVRVLGLAVVVGCRSVDEFRKQLSDQRIH